MRYKTNMIKCQKNIMVSMQTFSSFLITLILIASTGLSNAKPLAFDNNDLPLLGNSDQQYLTKQQAQKIGNSFYQSAMLSSILIDDVEINLYLRALIAQLHNYSQFTADPIRILIINNSEINAFALPGNIIVVHSGLFLAVQKESELVGVLAHELAHLKQQHILRLFSEQQKSQPKLILALLAALLVAPNAQSRNAIITSGIASSIQTTIDYTRKQEYEADRIAINILVKAGFDPEGISHFFAILAQQSGLSGGLASGSEFLRTHPLSKNRISEAQNRIQDIDRSNLIIDSAIFQRLKTRLAITLYNYPIKKDSCYQSLLNRQQSVRQGLVQEDEMPACSVKKISQNNYLKKEYGILLSLYDNINATPILQKLATDNPAHAQYQYALLEHYYRHNQFKSYIQHASQFLRHNTPLFPQFYQILSKVYYKNQQPDIAKYYLSLYYLAVGKQSLAQRILTKLKAQNKVDIILLQKIKTVLDQITIKKGNPS